ncbi:hypothetical protein A6R68_05012 [Neotoma lepida]|uniref:Uncharacterized protein n=1 Tax=Neotoma lepida TaxID=56216 RepID=A0A1A6GKP8_NEOLE|nr:hypothetical protein A6R68_05012 [Neotoma lepida]
MVAHVKSPTLSSKQQQKETLHWKGLRGETPISSLSSNAKKKECVKRTRKERRSGHWAMCQPVTELKKQMMLHLDDRIHRI